MKLRPENDDLLALQDSLDHYFTYFKDPNILAISEDKDSLPFAFVINDKKYKHNLLLSVSVEAMGDKAAEIALWASKIRSTALTDTFYISKLGITYTGHDALKYRELDLTIPLEEVDPSDDTLH